MASARSSAAQASALSRTGRSAAQEAWATLAAMVPAHSSAQSLAAAQAAAHATVQELERRRRQRAAQQTTLQPSVVDLAPSYSTLTLNADPPSTRLGLARPAPEEDGLPTYEEAMKSNVSQGSSLEDDVFEN